MAVLRLPDRIVRDFAGIQRNFEAILAAFPLAAGFLGPDSVTNVELRDDVAVDALRAVTTNHIRNGAVTPLKLDPAVWTSPALTGNPTAPTPAPGDNDTSIATTAFVQSAVSGVSVTAPSYATLTKFGVD